LPIWPRFSDGLAVQAVIDAAFSSNQSKNWALVARK
jgi:hypothetical protein